MAPKKSKVKKPKVKRSVTQPAKSIIERTICSHPMLKRVQKEVSHSFNVFSKRSDMSLSNKARAWRSGLGRGLALPTLAFVITQMLCFILLFRYGQSKSKCTKDDEKTILDSNSTWQQKDYSCKSASSLFQEANVGADSDKIKRHGYHEAYGPFLLHYLCTPNIRLLEIGVQNGNSLKLWQNLFPGHQLIAGVVYGTFGSVKVDEFKSQLSDRTVLYHGDQSDANFLKQLEKDLKGQKFDVIVDDGSHVPWHQLFTLERIFGTLLKEGGIYIIEDIETSYWDRKDKLPSIYGMYKIRGAGVGTRGSVVQKLKEIPELITTLLQFHFPGIA
ncbi:unnamed protein product [Bathycoccus prasinos]